MSRTTFSRVRRAVAGHPAMTAVVSAAVLGTVFLTGSPVLPLWAAAIAWLLWFAWRRPSTVGTHPDAPARVLAAAVALIPPERRDSGAAMTAELAGISDRWVRWRFALGCARASLFPPPSGVRPATGWIGGAVGLVGVAACILAVRHMLDGYPSSSDAVTPLSWALLVVVPAIGLLLALAAPSTLTTTPVSRRLGMLIGVVTGVGLYLLSQAGLLASGAGTFIVPMQFLAFAVLPSVIARITRSRRAGVQAIVWGYVFGTLATFPVYVVESIRFFRLGGGLYLDGETLTNIGTNLDDAVLWLFLMGPILLIPLGVAGVVLAPTLGRTTERVDPHA